MHATQNGEPPPCTSPLQLQRQLVIPTGWQHYSEGSFPIPATSTQMRGAAASARGSTPGPTSARRGEQWGRRPLADAQLQRFAHQRSHTKSPQMFARRIVRPADRFHPPGVAIRAQHTMLLAAWLLCLCRAQCLPRYYYYLFFTFWVLIEKKMYNICGCLITPV